MLVTTPDPGRAPDLITGFVELLAHAIHHAWRPGTCHHAWNAWRSALWSSTPHTLLICALRTPALLIRPTHLNITNTRPTHPSITNTPYATCCGTLSTQVNSAKSVNSANDNNIIVVPRQLCQGGKNTGGGGARGAGVAVHVCVRCVAPSTGVAVTDRHAYSRVHGLVWAPVNPCGTLHTPEGQLATWECVCPCISTQHSCCR